MSRKPIPDSVQNSVLLKSRRRCCLCFWLSGIDEVQKGQIAHLDQDNENPNEDNLAFLCFNHHDEYDGKTSQSKGLKQDEIRKWRDELYREIESRFRTFRKKELLLEIHNLTLSVIRETGALMDDFGLAFRLRNIGEAPIRRPVASIGLPDNVNAKPEQYMELPFGGRAKLPDLDVRGFAEIREDFFEPGGRVASISPLPPLDHLLLPQHSVPFSGLDLNFPDYPPGSTIRLKYRVDAEDMDPLVGELSYEIPLELAEALKRFD